MTDTPRPVLSFRGVSVSKGGRPILRDIDLELGERRIGIVGRNGSGKSTLARLCNGIERPSHGTVAVDGQTDRKALRRAVGFVFQNPDSQIVYPIVSEDLEFGLKNLGLPKPEIRARIDAILARLGLDPLRDRLTHQLSGGEKQMVALAGVLVMEPRVIVLDEPATLLDLWNRNRLMTVLRELDQTVIMVSHHLDLLDGFDRVLHVGDGTILDDGPPDRVIPAYVARETC